MDRTQQIILGVAGVLVLYQIIRGWRMGPIRQLIRFGALAAAYTAGMFGAPALLPLLRPLHFPDFLLEPFAGLILGILTCFFVNLFGGLLFKKTTDQNFGLAWLLYGVTGGLLGLAYGLLLVVAASIVIRFLGVMVEGGASVVPAPALVQSGHRQPALAPASETPPRTNPVTSTVLLLKQSLEMGLPGEFLHMVDPVPKASYETVAKVGQLVSHPAAINRLIDYPGAKEIVQSPEIDALRTDPEIVREASAHHYLALLKNARVLKTCNDPKTAKLLKKFDFEKALDFALEQ